MGLTRTTKNKKKILEKSKQSKGLNMNKDTTETRIGTVQNEGNESDEEGKTEQLEEKTEGENEQLEETTGKKRGLKTGEFSQPGMEKDMTHGKTRTTSVAETMKVVNKPKTMGEDKSEITRKGILAALAREQRSLKIGLKFFTELRKFDLYARQ